MLPASHSSDSFKKDFSSLISNARLAAILRPFARSRGRRPEVSTADLIRALVFHFLEGAGSLSHHLHLLLGKKLSASSISERRAGIPWHVFSDLLQACLKPIADPDQHTAAFFYPWRLAVSVKVVVQEISNYF